MVHAISHRELVFDLGRDDVPHFEKLLQFGKHVIEVGSADAESINRSLNCIDKCCLAHDCYPLISELALIREAEPDRTGSLPVFTSFISVRTDRVEFGAKIAAHYVNAMDDMVRLATPIIPHPNLYSDENALIVFRCCDIAIDRVPTSPPGHPWAAGKLGFELIKQGTSKVSETKKVIDEVPRFAEYFVRRIHAACDNDLTTFLDYLRHSTLLVIPFVRPYFRPVAQVSERDGSAPGGALLLFCAGHGLSDKEQIKRLARELAGLLAAGGIREAVSQRTFAENARNLLGSIVHGAVNAVRMIGSANLCGVLSDRVPPRDVGDLRIREASEDPERTREVFAALNQIVLGEDTAAALLAFAEMHAAHSDHLPLKFQCAEETDFDDVIRSALCFVNHFATHSKTRRYARVQLLPRDRRTPVRWRIPRGYLDPQILRGLFSEIIRNASEYGERGATGDVLLFYKSSCRGPDVVCTLANTPLPTHGGKEKSPTSGFLYRLIRAQSGLPGLHVQTREREKTFVVRVRLGEWKALPERRGDTPETVQLSAY